MHGKPNYWACRYIDYSKFNASEIKFIKNYGDFIIYYSSNKSRDLEIIKSLLANRKNTFSENNYQIFLQTNEATISQIWHKIVISEEYFNYLKDFNKSLNIRHYYVVRYLATFSDSTWYFDCDEAVKRIIWDSQSQIFEEYQVKFMNLVGEIIKGFSFDEFINSINIYHGFDSIYRARKDRKDYLKYSITINKYSTDLYLSQISKNDLVGNSLQEIETLTDDESMHYEIEAIKLKYEIIKAIRSKYNFNAHCKTLHLEPKMIDDYYEIF